MESNIGLMSYKSKIDFEEDWNFENYEIDKGLRCNYFFSQNGESDNMIPFTRESVSDCSYPLQQYENSAAPYNDRLNRVPGDDYSFRNAQVYNSVKLPAPPVEVKIFVGNVPATDEEEELSRTFGEFGRIAEIVLLRNFMSGLRRGCALIRMSSIGSADCAIREINKSGKYLVRYATGEAQRLGLPLDSSGEGFDQSKLFVGSLPADVTESEVRSLFSTYGVVLEVFLIGFTGRSGCAFVKVATKEQAFHAISNLSGKYTMPGSARAIEVRFANTKKGNHLKDKYRQREMLKDGIDKQQLTAQACQASSMEASPPSNSNLVQLKNLNTFGPQGANIFIFYVPNEWTQFHLLTHFLPFGQIVGARIACGKTTGRNRGFAFISYMDVSSAVLAVKTMNGFEAFGKRLKVRIKRGEEEHAEQWMHTNNLMQYHSNFGLTTSSNYFTQKNL